MEQFIVKTDSTVRLDNYILNAIPSLTLGKLNKYLRENKIKVNGKKLPLSTRLIRGDEIKLFLPLEKADTHSFENAKGLLGIVYEDSKVMIVQKPAGLLVQNELGQQDDNLLNKVYKYLHDKGEYIEGETQNKVRLCHRLDTGTSGLVIIAKDEQSESLICELIEKRKIKKEYICVSFGIPKPSDATLKAHLIKDSAQGHVQIREQECKGSKQIITEYHTLASSGRLALLSVNLITGRTHQIRAHLAYIGCPILGDSKYGNNAANRSYKLKYQALCAYKLSFPKLDGTYLENLSNKCYTADKPWYYEQIISKQLR